MSFLKPEEWHLLCASFQDVLPFDYPDEQSGEDGLVAAVVSGDYLAALRSPTARRLLHHASGTEEPPAGESAEATCAYFAAVEQSAGAVIAEHANLTGPAQDASESPGNLFAERPPQLATAAPTAPKQAALGGVSTSAGDRWALARLAASGEEAEGRCALPQYLLLARTLLLPPLGLPASADAGEASTQGGGAGEGLPRSWHWWAMRLVVQQQRLLAGPAAALRAELQQLAPQAIALAEELSSAGSSPGAAAAARLEAALMEQGFRDVGAARAHLDAANAALGLTVEVTGALGMRTEHQQDVKAQLVVRTAHAPRSAARNGIACETRGGAREGDCGSGDEAAALDAAAAGSPAGELGGLSAVSDVLPTPRLLDSDGSPPQALRSLEQAALLAAAVQAQRASAADELRAWQAAPFLDAVLRQPRSRFLLRAAARLLRARHERERPRTRERALLALQQLVEAKHAPWPPTARRLRLAFMVGFPLWPALQKELGEQLVAAGLPGSALALFEAAGLWDAALLSLRLLGKTAQALALARARLEAAPDEPRLLCALGDLTVDDACYERAWAASGGRSVRAKRSLARSAQRRKDFAAAAGHWEAALAVNPLHAEGWFALGFCALKTADAVRAAQAFTRAAQQDPDNGEAWNNLAAVHLQAGRHAEAYSALGEAVRLKRDSWQTWANYARAASQAGHPLQAARGVIQVMALTEGRCVEMDVLAALVAAVCAAREASCTLGLELRGSERTEAAALERAVSDALAQAVSASGAPPGVWGLLADFHGATGSRASEREALLKQVRALQGGGWQADPERFRAYAAAAVLLADSQAAGVHAGDLEPRELASTRMLLRSLLKQAAERFADSSEFGDAQRVLQQTEALERGARSE
ncbi:hypothetical protein WJX81_003255 [Elliptochloris bilobata]|uniref:Uncharacterized protein n=1 Tax=Elliptochloris bilobata TaxID=381761 RepID=A0AAW1R274_9CHLO